MEAYEEDIIRSKSASTSRANSPIMYSMAQSQSMALDFLCSGSPPVTPRSQTHRYRRSVSHKTGLNCELDQVLEEQWLSEVTRPRVYSVPSRDVPKKVTEVAKIRGFAITPKGLVIKGNIVQNQSSSNSPSCGTDGSSPDSPESSRSKQRSRDVYKVYLLGSTDVGKHALINTFVCEKNEHALIDEENVKTVSIILDNEESTMEFIDLSDTRLPAASERAQAAAYVVVYSVEDRRSFEAAINRLLEIREDAGDNVATILVANKTDLVRTRIVSEEGKSGQSGTRRSLAKVVSEIDGLTAAKTYDSKYIEISVALDLNTDELLVGVLQQIRLHKRKQDKKRHKPHRFILGGCCLLQASNRTFSKLFKFSKDRSKSSDNLYVL